MKKIKEKLSTWDEGKAFINRLADEFGLKAERAGTNLSIENDRLFANCHFDDREFSYILIKLKDESLEGKIKDLLQEFESK